MEKNSVVTLGIFAHANAGKTTLTEELLFATHETKEIGRVDSGTTVTDNLGVEKARGISVRSSLVNFKLPSLKKVQLIDTPGHIDFASEVERAMLVLDAAVLVISGVEGIEAQTYTIWNALKKKNIPVMFFINKLDRKGADFSGVCKQLNNELGKEIIPIVDIKISENKIAISNIEPLSLLDSLSRFDDECVEKYLRCVDSKTIPDSKFLDDKIKSLYETNKIYPVIGGSALKGQGIDTFIESLDKFLPSFKRKIIGDFAGVVYAVRVGKTLDVYTKILNGKINKRDEVKISEEETQKIVDIKIPSHSSFQSIQSAESGDIVILNGLDLQVGATIGNAKVSSSKFVHPLLNMQVKSKDMQKAMEIIRILEKEDPYIKSYYDRMSNEIILSLMGEVQAQVLEQVIKERFSLDVQIVNPTIICKERPTKIGRGKCSYTKVSGVELEVEPLKDSDEIIFESKIPTGTLLRKYQRQVERLVMQYKEQGLHGWELSGIKISLIDGYFDSMGSQTLDFNIATPIALFRALKDANTKIFEPYCKYNIKIKKNDVGVVTARLDARGNKFFIKDGLNDFINVYGISKLENLLSFQNEVRKLTSGRGDFFYELESYKESSNQDRELKFKGFNPTNENYFVVHEMGASMVPLDAMPTKKKNMSSKYAWKQLKKSLGR